MKKLEKIAPLGKQLVSLALQGNPVCRADVNPEYTGRSNMRLSIIEIFPELGLLNGVPVTESEQRSARPYFGDEFEGFLSSNGAKSGARAGGGGILARALKLAGRDGSGSGNGGGGGGGGDGGGGKLSLESPRTPRGPKGKRPVMKAISPRTARNATLKQPLQLDNKIADFRAKIMKMRSTVDAAAAKAENEREKERDRVMESKRAMARLEREREEREKEEEEAREKEAALYIAKPAASSSRESKAGSKPKTSRKKQGLRDALNFAERVEADVHGNGSEERKGSNPIEDLVNEMIFITNQSTKAGSL